MDKMPNDSWVWIARSVGAVTGSAISIAYLLPDSRREAALRFAIGCCAGLVFGSMAGLKLAQELDLLEMMGPAEIALVGAGFTSLCAWWLIGALRRIITTAGPPPANRSGKKSSDG